MSAFQKADVQNVGGGIYLNVRLWPKADIQRGYNFPIYDPFRERFVCQQLDSARKCMLLDAHSDRC